MWHGKTDQVQGAFTDWSTPVVQNFVKYLQAHRDRIPDYASYQSQGIPIGSGDIESTIKRIGSRLKISGAQWKRENVSQVLKHRCFYLNLAVA